MRRTLRAFLSYRRSDASEAAELERQLALRGVTLWRDVNDLPLGGLTEPEIRRGIAESDAFLLYATRRVFASDVIWGLEVPAALDRAAREATRGRRYPVIPVFRGLSAREFRRRAARLGCNDLPTRNGAFVPLKRNDRATKSVRREAHSAVATKLLRALLPDVRPGPLSIALRSFDSPEAHRATLDLDWSNAIDAAGSRGWTDELVPALRGVKAELARAQRRRVAMFVQTRIGAALLAGMLFPLASGFELAVRDRQGAWPGHGGRAVLKREDPRSGGGGRAVLEVSLAQSALVSAAALAAGLRARHVRLTPSGGPSRTFDPRPHAGGIARQIGDLTRALRAEGVRDTHLVFSGPAALAVLVGRHLHAIGFVNCYYRTAEGELVRAYRFRT